MMLDGTMIGPAAAIMAGLVTSLHCVGMCGPLACAACASPCGKSAFTAGLTYHGARLISYSVVGAAAGLIGARLSEALMGGATRGMAWVFIIFFVAIAAGLDKRIRLPMGAGAGRIFGRLSQLAPGARAGLLGLSTPMLPCAPLYLMVAAAALSGSAIAGSLVMAAFSLGTMPLLFLLQNRLTWLQQKCSPRTMEYTRRGLALVGVVLLLARATYAPETGCPLCL